MILNSQSVHHNSHWFLCRQRRIRDQPVWFKLIFKNEKKTKEVSRLWIHDHGCPWNSSKNLLYLWATWVFIKIKSVPVNSIYLKKKARWHRIETTIHANIYLFILFLFIYLESLLGGAALCKSWLTGR